MANDDGLNPGGNDDAQNKSGKGDGDAAGKSAENKTGKQVDGAGDDKNDDKPEGKFMTQADIDRIVQTRVTRATKDAEDAAKLSKEQLLEKQRDDAIATVRERDLKDDFIVATGLDTAKGSRFFRMYRDDIETDDKGKPTNLKDVVKTFQKDFPELFKKVSGGGDGGNGSAGDKAAGADMNSVLRRMAGRG